MRKLGIVLFVFMMQVFSAQATRFVYQMNFRPDSTNVKNVKTELANLDVMNGKSVFYGDSRLKRDSIIDRMRQTRTFDRSQMENLRSSINFIVEKDLVNHSLVYKDRVGRDQYSYPETADFKWKILPETAVIGEYKTQKAETIYGGRIWYAWFATEIPISDGPYKFSGLPGLIVKAEDKNGDYSFDLMQTKKIAQIQELQNRGQIIAISKDKFRQLQQKFQSDPLTYMNQNGNSGGRGGFGGQRTGGNRGGMQMSQTDRQEMQKRMVEGIKSNNNPIELK